MPLRSFTVRRLVLATAATALALLVAFTACQIDTTQQFGSPGALSLQPFPDPPDAPALSCEAAVPGPRKDGGCDVSWSTTIFPKLEAAGVWKCGNGPSCHGTDRVPAVVAANPGATYTNFTAATSWKPGTAGQRPYVAIDAGDDPDASPMLCNLKIEALCGTVMPQGITLACNQDILDLRTWIACGAPNN